MELPHLVVGHLPGSQAERVERALSESEARFRSVVETASDVIVLGDQNGNIIAWDNAAQALFGYAAEEVLGEPLTLIMPTRYGPRIRGGSSGYVQPATHTSSAKGSS